MASRPLVVVVDDDESVRESLPDLLVALGYTACAFDSADAFLGSGILRQAQCLMLDIAMPDMPGPELFRELRARGHDIPVIFITAQMNASVRPNLMAEGAVDCLFKPFSEQGLRAALQSALGGP